VSGNLLKTAIYGLVFIFIINLIMMIYNISIGSNIYQFTESQSLFERIWLIILTTLPFHGVASLIMYLVNLF
jgi:type III secretory pathway component EscS